MDRRAAQPASHSAPAGGGSWLPTTSDWWLFAVLGTLGVLAAHINIPIPHTAVFIELRLAFALVAFAFISRAWLAAVLMVLLAAALPDPNRVGMHIVIFGNLLYMVPNFLVFRYYQRVYRRWISNIYIYGIVWFLLVLACYQLFNTPLVWALIANINGEPMLEGVAAAFREQPFFLESLAAGLISALLAMVLVTHRRVRRGEYELAITLDSIGDAVVATDIEGNITRMNQVAEQLTGWTAAEATGQPVTNIMRLHNALTGEVVDNPVGRVLAEGTVVGLANHTCLVSRDGTQRQIADSAAPIRDSEGRLHGVVLVFRDVTHDYESRERLRTSEQSLRTLIEATPLAIVAVNATGEVTLWNEAAASIFGWSRDEALGGRIPYIPPESMEQHQREIGLVLDGKTFTNLIRKRLRKDGTEITVSLSTAPLYDAHGRVSGAMGIIEDITERQQAREQLAFQAMVLNQIQDLVTVTDLEGNITYVNDAELRMLGYDRGDIVGQNVEAYGEDTELGTAQQEIVAATVRDGYWRGEVINYTREGQPVSLDVRTQVIRDASGEPVALCGISTDITERKQAEERVREAQRRYREIFEGSRDGYVMVAPDATISDANAAFCEMLGYTLEELKTLPDFYAITPERWHQWEHEVIWEDRLLGHGYSGIYEKEYIHRDGTTFPVELQSYAVIDESGEVSYLWGVVRDITERKRIERALTASEERYRLLAETAREMILLHDLEGQILYMNQAATEFAGFSQVSATGRNVMEFIAPEYHEAVFLNRQRRETGDRSTYRFEVEVVGESGQRLPVEVNSTLVTGNGEKDRVLIVARDIFERKEAERQIRESKQRLDLAVQAAKMGIWEWDILSGEVVWDEAHERFCGLEPGSFPGTLDAVLECVHPLDREPYLAALHQTVEKDTNLDLTYRALLNGGRTRWLHSYGQLVDNDGEKRSRVIGTTHDITDKVQAEEAYVRLCRMSTELICIADLNTAKFLQVNPAFIQVLGLTEEELLNRPLYDFIHPDDVEASVEVVNDQLRKGLEVVSFENRYLAKDGRYRYLEWNAHPIPEEGITFAIAHDITERKETERVLRESEQRFRSFVENASDIVYAVDLAGNFTYVSPNWQEFYGQPPQEAIGRSFREYVHPRDREYCEQQIELMLAGENTEQSVEYRIVRPDGGVRWHTSTGAALYGPDGEVVGFNGIARDITERKQAELALTASERRFRSLLDSLEHIPIQGYDYNRRVVYWNAASEKVYGYTQDEAMGQRLEELIIPEVDRPQAVAQISRWLSEDKPIPSGELVLEDKHGNPVSVYSAHVMHLTADGQRELYCVDIDLRPLRASEAERERLIHAIEQTGEIVVITDTEGIIQYVNPVFSEITGYSRAEAIGQNPRFLKSGVHEAEYYQDLWMTISAGRTWQGSFTNRRKDGTLYHEEATISPVTDETGAIINYVAVKRDVTASLAIEAEKAHLEEQVQQSQKLESIGRLAGGVAHDLNNLLSPILGYSEMLLEEASPGDESRFSLEEIVQASMRARDLVRQLLAFSRKQVLEFKPLDLNAVIEEFRKLLRRTIREDVELEFELEQGLPSVSGDVGQIEQMLMNLAVNAQDAMPEGGSLTIATSKAELDEDYVASHEGTAPGTYVQLELRDTGIGMPPDVMNHIFEPFFTTKPVDQGTGLGLATVYGIIKQHGGSINVYSEPGMGTRFRIYLPLADGMQAAMAEAANIPASTRGDETILLVEDNSQVRKLTHRMLSRHGYNVLVAGSGSEALGLVADYTGPLNLLLTDVIMPGMSGRELYEKLSSSRPQLRVLYMSGYSYDVIAKHGIMEESVNFIEKPFLAEALSLKVRTALDSPRVKR